MARADRGATFEPMTRWLAIALLAACAHQDGGSCTSDSDCDGDVCARDDQCYAAGDVRAVRVTWTISHQAASATTCASNPDLEVDFDPDTSAGFIGGIGFAPVPCAAGLFNVDKMPTLYTSVAVSGIAVELDADGNASVDLPF